MDFSRQKVFFTAVFITAFTLHSGSKNDEINRLRLITWLVLLKKFDYKKKELLIKTLFPPILLVSEIIDFFNSNFSRN